MANAGNSTGLYMFWPPKWWDQTSVKLKAKVWNHFYIKVACGLVKTSSSFQSCRHDSDRRVKLWHRSSDAPFVVKVNPAAALWHLPSRHCVQFISSLLTVCFHDAVLLWILLTWRSSTKQIAGKQQWPAHYLKIRRCTVHGGRLFHQSSVDEHLNLWLLPPIFA